MGVDVEADHPGVRQPLARLAHAGPPSGRVGRHQRNEAAGEAADELFGFFPAGRDLVEAVRAVGIFQVAGRHEERRDAQLVHARHHRLGLGEAVVGVTPDFDRYPRRGD
jgi:hypothetical protein